MNPRRFAQFLVAAILNALLISSFAYQSASAQATDEAEAKRQAEIRKALPPLSAKDGQDLAQILQLFKQTRSLTEAGRHDEALIPAQRALEFAEKKFAKKMPSAVAEQVNNLGAIYHAKGDDNKAEQLYLRAIAIYEKQPEVLAVEMVAPLNNLAQIYFDKYDYKRAEPLYERALAIREKSLGLEHLDTAISSFNLAQLYMVTARLSLAEPLAQRALNIFEKKFGVEDARVADSLEWLCCMNLKRYPLDLLIYAWTL